jgi:Ala-tRNA(Pro) deacylase
MENAMLKTLSEFLNSHHVRYITLYHSTAHTAQEIAQAAHIHGREFAKTVIVKIDGKLAMAVLPAPEKLDTDLLAGICAAKKVELAGENEFQGRFPRCEIGAMPPFGNFFDMNVYLEEEIVSHDRMTFNAGTHTELVQMPVKDYLEIVQPKVARLCKSYVE